jgi:elongation factor P
MLTATQLKNNIYFEYEKEPYRVLKYKHTHLGRGGANIRIKAKNLKTNSIKSLNFGSSDRFYEVDLQKKPMQYLYQEGNNLMFMDPDSFEQIEVDKKILGEQFRFLNEGQTVAVMFWQDKPLDIDLPIAVVLEVKESAPGIKGNSATNIFKSAVLSNGLSLKVPLFIKEGDKVKVDTRTGQYLERL